MHIPDLEQARGGVEAELAVPVRGALLIYIQIERERERESYKAIC